MELEVLERFSRLGVQYRLDVSIELDHETASPLKEKESAGRLERLVAALKERIADAEESSEVSGWIAKRHGAKVKARYDPDSGPRGWRFVYWSGDSSENESKVLLWPG